MISPIEMHGQTVRTQDYTQMKHQEDTKGVVQQSEIQGEMKKNDVLRMNRVNQGEQVDNHHMNHHDAQEKGKNEYQGDGGRNRRNNEKQEKEEREADGKVLIKGIAKDTNKNQKLNIEITALSGKTE